MFFFPKVSGVLRTSGDFLSLGPYYSVPFGAFFLGFFLANLRI